MKKRALGFVVAACSPGVLARAETAGAAAADGAGTAATTTMLVNASATTNSTPTDR